MERRDHFKEFRIISTTLEAKQFFKPEEAIETYLKEARKQHFHPPYKYVLIIDIDADALELIEYEEQELDMFPAITISEDNLPAFNNCIKFVEHYAISATI